MNAAFQEALEKGVELFNRQEFYEAHEAWEAGWIDEVGDERVLLQGLIQVAAGFYKLQTGAPNGTVKLLEQGLVKVQKFRDDPMGVDLDALVPEVERWLTEARAMVVEGRAAFDPKKLPKLGYRRLLH